jgi:DNA polymerase elongation subunit (family B)
MFDSIHPENLLYIDIETVPQFEAYHLMDDAGKKLWNKKASFIGDKESDPADLYSRAGIYAEFGKIICISVGYLHRTGGTRKARIKSFFGDDERSLLTDFRVMLEACSSKKDLSLCAHNGKEFDFPYLSRRMMVNGISLPAVLDNAGKKPWEVKFVDTLELWKFGDYKHYTSLELLAYLFGIPTPKDDIDGSMVAGIYYQEKDLPRIARYCEKDVLTIIRLLLKFAGQDTIAEEHVELIGM